MASQTEVITIADVVKSEAASQHCREVYVVATSEVLSLGEICFLDSSGELEACGAVVNEVQTIAMGAFTAGTCRLRLTDPVTGETAVTAELTDAMTLANVKTKLEETAIVAVDDIVVGGTDVDAFTLTFSVNNWAGVLVPLVEVVPQSAFDAALFPSVVRTTPGHSVGGDATHVALATVTGDGTLTCLTIARGPCVLDKNRLTVPTGGLANAVAALKALGIIARPEPTEYTEGVS